MAEDAPPSTPRRAAVLVMAKAPRAGRVKTRLEPLLGPERCARLQAELLTGTAWWASRLRLGDVFVAYAPPSAAPEIAALVPPGVKLFPQVGEDLGSRLAAATTHVLDRDPGPLLVVGTDTPAVGRAHALGALQRMARGADVCFGPAADGGYYLVGMRCPQPAIFSLDRAVWGGPRVLEESVAAARRAGLTVSLLWQEHDLDEPDDAAALLAAGTLPPRIAALLGDGSSRSPSAEEPTRDQRPDDQQPSRRFNRPGRRPP